jgi:hypothetical protein
LNHWGTLVAFCFATVGRRVRGCRIELALESVGSCDILARQKQPWMNNCGSPLFAEQLAICNPFLRCRRAHVYGTSSFSQARFDAFIRGFRLLDGIEASKIRLSPLQAPWKGESKTPF